MEIVPEYHEIEGIGLMEVRFHEPRPIRSSSSSYASRHGIMTLCLSNHKDYSFVAYPGPAVVTAGSRAEHSPLHFHVKCKQANGELRIRTEDFEEYDGLFIPRDLRRFMSQVEVHDYLVRNTRNVFETGKMLDEKRIF